MKISALRIFNVRRFAGRGVAIEGIGDGVNVLCAANEFGKSTSFDALHALFFQPYTGTPGDIQRLRPYSGGSPLVEADIATNEGRFRLTKQYYSGKRADVTDLATGRLIAQAGDAENFIGNLIKGGTAGPAGLLWVRQGNTGLEKRRGVEEDIEKSARAGLLESVQGEVEAITGGRRMAEILARCLEALGELVTSGGKPKSGGRYAAAIEVRERLVTEEQQLGAEVNALREALDQRATAVKRLNELEKPEERQGQREAIQRTQSAVDVAKAQGEAIKTAEAQLKLARERRDAADRELKAFREGLDKASRLRTDHKAAALRRDESARLRAAAQNEAEKAAAESGSAEDAVDEARTLLARIEAAIRSREAAERLDELRLQLASAEKARNNLEEAEARLKQLKISSAAIDELQQLELEIAGLRAVDESARPTVVIQYETGSPNQVTLDGQTLNHDEERSFQSQALLSIPGTGLITVRANRPTERARRLEQANEKRGAFLTALGVDDLGVARKRHSDAQRKEAAVRELRGRLEGLAPSGLATLREEVARRAASAVDIVEVKGDVDQVRIQFAKAEQRRTEAKSALREVSLVQAKAQDAYVAAEVAAASLAADIGHMDSFLGDEALRDQRQRGLIENSARLEALFAEAEVRLADLRASSANLEAAEASLRRAKSVEEGATREISTLRETIAGLNGQIRSDSDRAIEEEWRAASEALSIGTQRIQSVEKEVAVLQRLRGALENARSAARDLYLKPVISELRPLLGFLFDDVSITFDETTLLPQTISRKGQEEEVDRLSGGMREQLSVLTRLAFARLLACNGRPAPVILDDALVYSDDDRIERMFDALHRQARDQQIIVFSCRQRAFAKLGGNVLQMIDWNPQK